MAASKAYQIAKEGGRNQGFLRNYEALPDHLIEKAIRSLGARAQEHRDWIADPRSKVDPELDEEQVKNLVR